MLSIPKDIIHLILTNYLSDWSKKQFLNTCIELRKTLSDYWFHDRVMCEHLSICPYSEKHTNILVTISNEGFSQAVRKVLGIKIENEYYTPTQITDLTIENCEHIWNSVVNLNLFNSIYLKNLSLSFSKDYKLVKSIVFPPNLSVPSSIEHLEYKTRHFTDFPLIGGSGLRSVQITEISGGKTMVMKMVPGNLKFLSARDKNGSIRKVPIPHKEDGFSIMFASRMMIDR